MWIFRPIWVRNWELRAWFGVFFYRGESLQKTREGKTMNGNREKRERFSGERSGARVDGTTGERLVFFSSCWA
jgi:hypothetical protein